MKIPMTMMRRMKKTNMMTMVMQKTVGEDYVDDDDADENDDNDYDDYDDDDEDDDDTHGVWVWTRRPDRPRNPEAARTRGAARTREPGWVGELGDPPQRTGRGGAAPEEAAPKPNQKIKGRGARTAAPIRRNDGGRGRDTTLSGWVCSWEGDTQ